MATRKTKFSEYDAQPSYRPIFIDSVIRLLLIYLYFFQGLNSVIFWVLQVVVVSVFVFFYAVIESESASSQIEKFMSLNKHTFVSSDPKAVDFFSLVAISAAWCISFYTYVALPIWAKIVLVIMIFLAFFILHGFLIVVTPRRISSKGAQAQSKIDQKTYGAQVKAQEEPGLGEVIMQQEIEINWLSSRVDAYTLESTLFGGLAFSGFLVIIFANVGSINSLHRFWALILSLFQILTNSGGPSGVDFGKEFFTATNVVAGIALLTLICSLFFVTALITRLRFSAFLSHVLQSYTLAKSSYSTQEELRLVSYQSSTSAKRVASQIAHLNTKITDTLAGSNFALSQLKYIASYVAFFRNCGLLTFVFVLAIGASLISSALAIFFLIFTSLSVLIGEIDFSTRLKNLRQKLNARKIAAEEKSKH